MECSSSKACRCRCGVGDGEGVGVTRGLEDSRSGAEVECFFKEQLGF